MREITIAPNDATQRLDRFLKKALPNLPTSAAQKYIRLKRIKLNGARTAQNVRLNVGDTIQLYIPDHFFAPAANAPRFITQDLPKPDICYEDAQILIADKPPNLPSHSGNQQETDTLIDRAKSYLYHSRQWNPGAEQSFVPALCNRLDRNTGGLVLIAKTAASAKMLNEKIRTRQVDKYYLLAVRGIPKPSSGQLIGALTKNRHENKVFLTETAKTPNAKSAVTEYRTLQTKNGLSLVECRLETGRTHQIRVQMAAIGCPLLGDRKYGIAGDKTEPHQALWAYRIRFHFTTDAGVLQYLNGQAFTSHEVPFMEKYFD